MYPITCNNITNKYPVKCLQIIDKFNLEQFFSTIKKGEKYTYVSFIKDENKKQIWLYKNNPGYDKAYDTMIYRLRFGKDNVNIIYPHKIIYKFKYDLNGILDINKLKGTSNKYLLDFFIYYSKKIDIYDSYSDEININNIDNDKYFSELSQLLVDEGILQGYCTESTIYLKYNSDILENTKETKCSKIILNFRNTSEYHECNISEFKNFVKNNKNTPTYIILK